MHYAKFVILHAIAAACAVAAWKAGMFSYLPPLGWLEIGLCGGLVVYCIPGFLAVLCGDWARVVHYANGVPKWGLAATGVGMIAAVAGLDELTPAVMAAVFRNLALSITPNIVGVLLMSWLGELAWLAGREEI